MKKHNKDVLRATLFALIAIFIMIRLLRVRLLLMQMITMECGTVRTAWRV